MVSMHTWHTFKSNTRGIKMARVINAEYVTVLLIKQWPAQNWIPYYTSILMTPHFNSTHVCMYVCICVGVQ